MRRPFLLLVFFSLMGGIILSCQSESERQLAQYLSGGKEIYNTYCKTCHGQNGEGLGQLAPPLTDTIFLKNNKANLACYIVNGTSQPMSINGQLYQEKMPKFNLANIDVSKVIVYITNSFGNKQGIYKPDQVAADLNNCN